MIAQGVAQLEAGKSRPEISGLDPSPRDGRHHREPWGIRGVREDGWYNVTLITQSWVSTWVTGHEFCPRSTTIAETLFWDRGFALYLGSEQGLCARGGGP